MYWFTLYGKPNIDAAKRFIGYTDADKRAFDYPQYFILPDKRRKVITHNRVIGEVCIGVEYVRDDESEEITGAELHITVTCYMVQNVGALLDAMKKIGFSGAVRAVSFLDGVEHTADFCTII